jgi:hypothetical protein
MRVTNNGEYDGLDITARNVKTKNTYTDFLYENLKGRDHLRDLEVDEDIILKWILKE